MCPTLAHEQAADLRGAVNESLRTRSFRCQDVSISEATPTTMFSTPGGTPAS